MKATDSAHPKRRLSTVIMVVAIVVIPLILWSYPSNPPLATTGAPGESSCAHCHNGGLGGGKISITSSSGKTYHPGTTQHLTVIITDAHAVDWGYEMTAVQATKPSVGQGKFKATDSNSNVRQSGTKSYASQINTQSGKTKTVSYKVDWTPPSKSVGNITLYVAGLGDDNSNPPNSSSVYLGKLTLSPK